MQNDREVRAREGVKFLRYNPRYGTDLVQPPVTKPPSLSPGMVYLNPRAPPVTGAAAGSSTTPTSSTIGNWPPKKSSVLKKTRPHTNSGAQNRTVPSSQPSPPRAASSPGGNSHFPANTPFELKELPPRPTQSSTSFRHYFINNLY